MRQFFKTIRWLVTAVCAVLASLPLLANAQEATQLARLSLPSVRRVHPIDPALEIARESLRHVRANVDDYSAIFVKRCRVNGEMPPLQFAKLKMRNRKIVEGNVETPMSVYLDFLKPDSVKGREVIWVEGENEGDMVVHQGGFASFFNTNVDPEGMLAMRGQRYSIKAIGIENLLTKVIETGLSDRRHGECVVNIDDQATFGKTKCTMVEITHPVQRDHFRFHLARVYFDNSTNLPIRYQAWLWPEAGSEDPVLDEEYNYFNMQVNQGLSASDFDTSNPEYRFR